jgi:colanic acid biosynthesis glycosyl transferase WcaI
MRILFFSEQFWPETNAPAIHVYERARLWAAAGHEVTVLTCAPNFPEGKVFQGYRNRFRQVEWVDGIRVLRIASFISPNQGFALRALDFLSYAAHAFLQALWEDPPEVVISTSPQLFTAVAGLLYAKALRRPHVFELRDLWPASIVSVGAMNSGWVIRALGRLECWCYRESAAVLAFTEAFQRDLVRRDIPPSKVVVIPNGTDLDIFKPMPADEATLRELGLEGKFVVGYLGTLGMAHRLDLVLEAAQQLSDTPVHFLFAGPGAEREALQEKAQAMGLRNVTFLARQPRTRVPALWSVCQAALISLKDDPLMATVVPSKLYEVVAMGLPILFMGPDGEASRLIRATGTGVTLPPEAPSPLVRAVRSWLERPEARVACAEAAGRARRAFGREAQAERTLTLLGEVIGMAP